MTTRVDWTNEQARRVLSDSALARGAGVAATRRTRRATLFALAAAPMLARPAGAAVQADSCGALTGAERRAPSAPLGADRPSDGASRYDIRVQGPRDAVARPLGTMAVAQRTVTCRAGAVIQRVIAYDYGAAGRVLDTTLSVASTLAPISERTRKPSGDIVLDFSAEGAVGHMTRLGTTRPIRDPFPAPAFNSTDLELVIRSLALRPGLTTVLAIYDPEFGGFRPDTVTVVALEPAAAPDSDGTWVVRSRNRRIESTYRIAERSRKLRAIDVRADSTRYWIARVPAVAPGAGRLPLSVTGPTSTGMVPDAYPEAARRRRLAPEIIVPPLRYLASTASRTDSPASASTRARGARTWRSKKRACGARAERAATSPDRDARLSGCRVPRVP